MVNQQIGGAGGSGRNGQSPADQELAARGSGSTQVQALYDQFMAALNNGDRNGAQQILGLLQQAATAGHDPQGQALASSLVSSAQQQLSGGGIGSDTGQALGVNPGYQGNQMGFQGGLTPPTTGGTELGAGSDAGNNVGGMGIANRIAQTLISQNPGASANAPTQTVTQGGLVAGQQGSGASSAAIPGQGGGGGGMTNGPWQAEVVPPNAQAGGGPGPMDSLGGSVGQFANNPGATVPTGPVTGPQVQLPGNYGSGWLDAAAQQAGAPPVSNQPTNVIYDPLGGGSQGGSYTPPPGSPANPTSGAGVGPSVALDPTYRAGNQQGILDSAGNPQAPGVTRALAAGMGNDPNMPNSSFNGPGEPDSLGSPHTMYPDPGAPRDLSSGNQVDADSWWGQAGINRSNMYTDYNPWDFQNGGFESVLNMYEHSANLPGYWSDQMGPLIQQAMLTSYLNGGQQMNTADVLNSIPTLATQFSTPGSYYDPTQDWQGFLSNPTPQAAGTGQDAYSQQKPRDQVAQAQQMWQAIAGQSVDPTYMQNTMWQIQALGEQYEVDHANVNSPTYFAGNFLDYMKAHGADSWL